METVSRVVEKPFSKEKVARLKGLFKELVRFKDSPDVMEYTVKRLAELKE